MKKGWKIGDFPPFFHCSPSVFWYFSVSVSEKLVLQETETRKHRNTKTL